MANVKVLGHKDPTNFTTEVIFDRDEETGEPKTVARVGEVSELSADQVAYLENDGFLLDTVTKKELRELEKEGDGSGPAPDVIGAGPVLSASSNPAPGASESERNDDAGAKSGSRKN